MINGQPERKLDMGDEPPVFSWARSCRGMSDACTTTSVSSLIDPPERAGAPLDRNAWIGSHVDLDVDFDLNVNLNAAVEVDVRRRANCFPSARGRAGWSSVGSSTATSMVEFTFRFRSTSTSKVARGQCEIV